MRFSLLSLAFSRASEQCVTFLSTIDEVGANPNKKTFNASRVETSSESGKDILVWLKVLTCFLFCYYSSGLNTVLCSKHFMYCIVLSKIWKFEKIRETSLNHFLFIKLLCPLYGINCIGHTLLIWQIFSCLDVSILWLLCSLTWSMYVFFAEKTTLHLNNITKETFNVSEYDNQLKSNADHGNLQLFFPCSLIELYL